MTAKIACGSITAVSGSIVPATPKGSASFIRARYANIIPSPVPRMSPVPPCRRTEAIATPSMVMTMTDRGVGQLAVELYPGQFKVARADAFQGFKIIKHFRIAHQVYIRCGSGQVARSDIQHRVLACNTFFGVTIFIEGSDNRRKHSPSQGYPRAIPFCRIQSPVLPDRAQMKSIVYDRRWSRWEGNNSPPEWYFPIPA